MSAQTGIIDSTSIEKNRDGEDKKLIAQTIITDPDDVQSVEIMRGVGDDFIPPNGSRFLIIKVGSAWKIAPIIDDGIEPDSNLSKGDRKLYSSKDGEVKGYIWIKNTGEILISGLDQKTRIENQSGFFEIGTDGQFNANDNFTVDV